VNIRVNLHASQLKKIILIEVVNDYKNTSYHKNIILYQSLGKKKRKGKEGRDTCVLGICPHDTVWSGA
jgi:hypothetical protein